MVGGASLRGVGVEVFHDGGSYSVHAKDLDVFHATFGPPDLSLFCNLDELGLVATGLSVGRDRALVQCRVVEPDRWCSGCGAEGIPRGSVVRRLAHVPFGMRPTTLLVRVRRYQCSGCGRFWRQDTSSASSCRRNVYPRVTGGSVCLFVDTELAGPRVKWLLRPVAVYPSSACGTTPSA